MAKFDQRDQKVTYQYNADVINLSNVSNRAEFAHELEKISSEIARASSRDAIDAIQAKKAQDALNEASVEAQRPEPNKGRLLAGDRWKRREGRNCVGRFIPGHH